MSETITVYRVKIGEIVAKDFTGETGCYWIGDERGRRVRTQKDPRFDFRSLDEAHECLVKRMTDLVDRRRAELAHAEKSLAEVVEAGPKVGRGWFY